MSAFVIPVETHASPAAVCPIAHAPPYTPPRSCPLPPALHRRLRRWCEEALPGVQVELAAWVGADLRQPPHALVVSFVRRRPPVVLYRKPEDVTRLELLRALGPS